MTTKNPQKIASQELDSLRTKLLDELESEARRMLTQLQQEFSDQLQAQSSDALDSFSQSLSGGGLSAGLIGAAAGELLDRPVIRTTSQETQRSLDAGTQFRLSQNQALAEAGTTLSKGNKNL
ncbi:MAG: hypothetical protein WDN72_04860 [Alphaproteobacteria bacterium]